MQSKAMKNFMAKLYGIGAAVVILGAMFKIMHWPGAGPMLVCGLTTEAIIFFFSAFEKPHEEPDWTLVWPELAMGHGGGHDDAFGDDEEEEEEEQKEHEGTITQQLDEMLEEAKVGPELIENLGSGLQSFSQNVSSMKNITDASIATEEYSTNVRKATESLSGVNDAYLKGSDVMNDLAGVSSDVKSNLAGVAGASDDYSQSLKSATTSLEEMNSSYSRAAGTMDELTNNTNPDAARGFSEQMGKMTENLSSLNSMYEMELKDSGEQLRSMKELYGGINEMMSTINESVEDSKKYKEQMALLSQNLTTLNAVYGNMLSAMRAPVSSSSAPASVNGDDS